MVLSSCGSLGLWVLGIGWSCDGVAGVGVVACLPSQVAMPALSGSRVGMEFCLALQALRAPSTASSHLCLSRRGCFLSLLLPLKSCLSLLRTLRLPFLNSLAMARSTSSSIILAWKLSLVLCSVELRCCHMSHATPVSFLIRATAQRLPLFFDLFAR